MNSVLHPVIKNFFVFLIDIKNIISLHKNLRWGIEAEPLFIQGGTIIESTLRRAVRSSDISEVSRLIYQITGISVQEPSVSEVEHILFSGLTRQLRVKAKENSDVELILDYLWKIYAEAQNLSLILYGKDIERENLQKELVIS